MKNKIILIGGTPIVGKTYNATKLSQQISTPWISTDHIRSVMRSVGDKKKYPKIFYFTKTTAKKYLSNHSPQQIVSDQNNESLEVWKGVKSFIDSAIRNDYPYIIEGIAVLPKLVYRDYKKNKTVKPIFLLDNNIDRISKRIYTRGLWDDADTYSDSLKEIEIKWVIEFNNWLKKELIKYKFPYIEIKNDTNVLKEIQKNIK